jgi:16S rRNA (guanine527-N7)-methyltransferase
MNDLWTQLAASANLTLTEAQHALLHRYLDLLIDANQRMNLTRIIDRPQAELHHIADALTVLKYLPPGEISIADVGAGSGVPGLPLAIARPDAKVTLIESTKKKATFLSETAQALGLSNVTVLAQRAEDVANPPYRQSFDVAVARAVAEIGWLAEWCLPLVKRGGTLLMMKGPKHAEELKAGNRVLRHLGGTDPRIHPVDTEGLAGHVILEVKKTATTNAKFPRPATAAKGKMLGS